MSEAKERGRDIHLFTELGREDCERKLTAIRFSLALCLTHFLVSFSFGSAGPERIVFILH